jgi:hypothetical protein
VGLIPVEVYAEMVCHEMETGEALCDDGTQMYYRSEPSASFVPLDEDTGLKVRAFLARNAGGSAAEDSDSAEGGHTTFFGSSGSITSEGDCVSLSAPGVSFMGSGC